ncbi:hypothetical protein BGZ46_005901 [Entomortierella lignicola]|nr:hypothetical protein BGZ46_005901 [Entomortierella lignicola]
MWTTKLVAPNHNRTTVLVSSFALRSAIRESSTSSTSALTYKQSHPRLRHPALTSEYLHPTNPSAEEAVSNILYNMPKSSSSRAKQPHIFNCLVQNEPGVLSRVSGILAGRGFNIDSLVVAKTEVRDLSRMTVVLKGEKSTVEQARRQLEDLVPVWAVLDYTDSKLIQRELLLIKVSILGPEHVRAQMKSRSPNWQLLQEETEVELSPSDALRQTHAHLKSLTELTKLFQGRVVDVASDCAVIELSAKPDRINSFLKLVKPFGILEAARSGMMAMPRSAIYDEYEDGENDSQKDDVPTVDASLLPPG